MNTETQHQLALKQKELDIFLAIDQVRDSAANPAAIFSGVVKVMAEQFATDLSLLYLINQETVKLELKVIKDRDHRWRQLGPTISHDLARQAMVVDQVSVWPAEAVLSPEALDQVPGPLSLAAVPIFMDEDPLGVLILGRAGQPFTDEDVELLAAAESQIDSAVVQAHMYHELRQRNKELETIYRFDHIRDQNLPFDEMLDVVLRELCEVIKAEMGFVMLYDHKGERLEMRAITHEDLSRNSEYYDLVNRLANESVERAHLICYGGKPKSRCSVMCVPLILRDEVIGVFGAVNREGSRGFKSDERRLLMAIVSQMDTAILEGMERRQLRRVLGRSVDPHVLERLLANPDVDILQGERMLMTVLYADLRGSTRLSQHIDPELLVDFINNYLERMTDVVLGHEGTLDKYVGDEVMALFGAPLPQPDHALRAVRVGLAMQERHHEIVEGWLARGIETAGLGVGIATGDLIVGEMGCERRTDYTVLGPAANLGSRICAAAPAGHVYISAATYELVADQIEAQAIPNNHFKGIEHAVTVYDVVKVA